MLKFSEKTCNKKELHLKNTYEPIRFANNIKIKNLHNIFDNLFNKARETYYINGRVHCGAYRGRSYYDCYLLCLHYFPKMSFYEMYYELRACVGKENPTFTDNWYGNLPCFSTCPTIGRSRFWGQFQKLNISK